MRKKSIKAAYAAALTAALAAALIIAAVAPAMASGANAAPAADRKVAVSDFDFDVVFVIDGSGSMMYSDPNRTTKLAASLFADLCSSSDTRGGFVLYSHVLSMVQPLINIGDGEGRQAFKDELGKIDYPATADTDIALGLATARDMLAEGGANEARRRKPIIILLSDGRTDLPKGPRTVDESNAELTLLKAELAGKKIPVYTIGLNYDGKLDVKTMTDIASSTNAIYKETVEAKQLPEIMSEIYAHAVMGQYSGDGGGSDRKRFESLGTVRADGSVQRKTITIPNNSIYEANIIMYSGQPVTDIKLYDPNKRQVVISEDNNLILIAENIYTMLKMRRPISKGDWELSFIGADGDEIVIKLLSTYDLSLGLSATRQKDMSDISDGGVIMQNEAVKFSAYLEDPVEAGKRIVDESLFEEAVLTLLLKTPDGAESALPFPNGASEVNARYVEPGAYAAKITMEVNDTLRESDYVGFSVAPLSLGFAMELGERAAGGAAVGAAGSTGTSAGSGVSVLNQGDSLVFSVYLYNPDEPEVKITDKNLFEGADIKLIILPPSGAAQEYAFGADSLSVARAFDEPGAYKAKATMAAGGLADNAISGASSGEAVPGAATGDAISGAASGTGAGAAPGNSAAGGAVTDGAPLETDYRSFRVVPDEIVVIGAIDVTMFSKFYKNQVRVDIDGLIENPKYSILTFNMEEGDWPDIFDIEYDKQARELVLTAKAGWKAETGLTVKDKFGQTARVPVSVYVIPIWTVILALSLILLILAAIVYRAIRRSVPYVDDALKSFHISIDDVPPNVKTPPETNLTMPHVKGSATLKQIIAHNSNVSGPYFNALDDIKIFVGKLTFKAKGKKGKTKLQLVIPTDRYGVLNVDAKDRAQPVVMDYRADRAVTVVLYKKERQDVRFEIAFGEDLEAGGFDGDFTDGFGGGPFDRSPSRGGGSFDFDEGPDKRGADADPFGDF